MTTDLVSVEKDDRVAIVRFDRGNTANALSFALMRELTAVAHDLADDPDLCAVVLTGRADNFCLGMDLKDEEVARSATAGLAERRAMLRTGPRLCRAWEELEALTIVAIEGWCAGGGAALAVSCDLRVIGTGGHVYVPEVERGMNMSWGSVPRFTNLVGPARAKRIIVLAEQLDAARALDWGLVDEVAADGATMEAALNMARPRRLVAAQRRAHVQVGNQCLRERTRSQRIARGNGSVRPGPGVGGLCRRREVVSRTKAAALHRPMNRTHSRLLQAGALEQIR